MIAVTGVLALLIAGVFSLLLIAVLNLREATNREAHSKDVTVASLALEKLVVDLETGVRGFVIAGNPRLLDPWTNARRRIPERINALERLVRDDAEQLRRVRGLAAAISAYEEDYSLPLVQIARESPAAARTPLATAEGERRMGGIRQSFASFLQEENARAAASAASAREGSSRALWLGIAGLGVSGAFVFGFGFYLMRSIARPVREAAGGASRVAAGDLSARLRETGPGEVGELTAAFNAMTESLQQSRTQLEGNVAQQRAVAGLSQRALAESDLAPLLEAAVRSVAETLGVEYAAIWELAPTGETLRLKAGAGWAAPDLEIPSAPALEDDEEAEDGAGHDLDVPLEPLGLAAHGVAGGLTVRVPAPGRPLAALGAYSAAERRFTRDEALFLRATASLLAAAVSRSRLEEGLRQAQKLEAVGRLAGGIAHDFNNILLAIKAEAWLLDTSLPPDAEEHEAVRAIESAAERARSLTRQLLAFSRQQPWRPELVDPSAAVADLARMLDPLIGEDVELSVDLDTEPGLIRIDRAQLEQVVMNLVVNARDAMPGGGRVTIAVRGVETPAGEEAAGPAGYVVLEVADTGVGIPREDQPQIFEPFFTRKADGSGLGLAIVHGIVTRAGGRIEVSSEPGDGATFSIHLPRVEGSAGALEGPSRRARLAHGSETLLLVEDDEMVRKPVGTILEAHGYRVLTAASAVEALRVTEQGERPIDLLITDVVMPDLSGPELTRVLQRLQPGLKVIYVSGYPERAAAFAGLADELASEQAVFVHKPFAPEVLLEEVAALLEREGPDGVTGERERPPAGLPERRAD